MKKVFVPACVIGLAIATPDEGAGATYSQDFDGFPNGTTDLGDGSVMAGDANIQNNALQLTQLGNSDSTSSFSIPGFPDSNLGWTATFDVTITAGGGPPGSGMSFNYGQATLGQLGSGEEGMAGIDGIDTNVSFEIDSFDLDSFGGVRIAEVADGEDTTLENSVGQIVNPGTTVTGQVMIQFYISKTLMGWIGPIDA